MLNASASTLTRLLTFASTPVWALEHQTADFMLCQHKAASCTGNVREFGVPVQRTLTLMTLMECLNESQCYGHRKQMWGPRAQILAVGLWAGMELQVEETVKASWLLVIR